MRFERLDLNLLVALNALLTEKSVSLAAERICLSQSATSSALGRLRDYFGDDLLVMKGRQMVLTARGEGLVDPVRAVLEQIKETIAITPPFDPASSDRNISFMASDYVTEVILADALKDIAAQAPLMTFEIQSMADQPVETMERGQVDFLLTVDFAISADHPSEILFEDDYVIIGCSQNPAMQTELDEETYFSLGHVTSRFGKTRILSFDDWFTRRKSRERRMELVAPSFLSIPSLLIGTERIATMHRRLAMRLVERHALLWRELPLDIPPIREAVQWDISNNNDPAIRWVVERLVAVAKDEPVRQTNVLPLAGLEEARRDFRSAEGRRG